MKCLYESRSHQIIIRWETAAKSCERQIFGRRQNFKSLILWRNSEKMFVSHKSKFLGCNLEKYFSHRNRRFANFLLSILHQASSFLKNLTLRKRRRKSHLLNAKSEEKEIPLQQPREFPRENYKTRRTIVKMFSILLYLRLLRSKLEIYFKKVDEKKIFE